MRWSASTHAAKKEASEALERGDRNSAMDMLAGAESSLMEAMSAAPVDLRADVAKETHDVSMMRERATWDDTSRLSKDTRASFHRENRKRGRE